jgi:predicted permease
MEQATEDAIGPVWKSHGFWGIARLLLDIALRLPVEYLAEVRQDIRYGLRMLATSKGFTAVALISLTLGIAVATAAFSELNGFVLRDVPAIRDPEQLVTLRGPTSYPHYKRYREHTDLFSGTLAYIAPVPFGVSFGGSTERIWGHLVTPGYFETLGAGLSFGRWFGRDEEQPGRAPTVVISHRFWEQRLSSDPSPVGKTLRINGHPCTILGVGGPGFRGASPMVAGADLWLPLSVGAQVAPELADNPTERHDLAIFHMVGRLKPGVLPVQAEAAMDASTRQVEQDYGDVDRNRKGPRVRLLPGGKLLPVPKNDLPFLTGFFAVLGGMILLIASFNVANMVLARAADRRKEIAVRLSLGASRFRLIRQLMTESLLVAAAAGVLGFFAASLLMRAASQQPLPYPMPLELQLQPDVRVFVFCLVMTVFTGLAFGLIPAIRATRADLSVALKEGSNLTVGRRRRFHLRNVLVLMQMAGSLALLLITGFLVIGHQKIAGTDVGFDARHLSMISLDPVRDGYTGPQTAAVLQKLVDRVRALPSVTAASLTDSVPMAMIGKPGTTYSTGDPGGGKKLHWARKADVGREYFGTLGIPIIAGRGFRQEDEANDAMSAIVSEKVARECWPQQQALGQRIEIGNSDVPRFDLPSKARTSSRANVPSKPVIVQVVGVVKDIRDGINVAASEAPGVIYLPLRPQQYARPVLHGFTIIARTAPGVDAISAIHREINATDARLTTFNARTMVAQIDDLLFPVRVALYTYGSIGMFGLILAAVGLAGVTAYSVAQRRREIGIRIALGARGRDVLGLVMKEGAGVVAMGTVVGLALSWVAIRALAAALFPIARTAGTTTSDPALYVGAPLILTTLAMLACYLPARRSLRIDPAESLRQE